MMSITLMRLLDEKYTKVPFYGVRGLTAWLRARGYIANPKRVRMLMRRMKLQAIFPHKRRSISSLDFNKKVYFFPTMRRSYIRAWATARPTRYILDIKLAKNLLSRGIKMVKIINVSGQKCTLNKPLYCPKNGEHLKLPILIN
jgi:hypothetical protein